MASSKAAFRGHCQVCGAPQKLPNGVLSKHGYSVQWGFFNGICSGAEHLPYEQSIELILGAIERASTQLASLLVQIRALRKPTTSTVAYCRIYRTQTSRSRGRVSGYAWHYGEIACATPQHGLRFVVVGDDNESHYIHCRWSDKSPLDVAAYQNKLYAKHLVLQGRQLRNYVRWQCARIREWVPSDLIPIETN